MVEKIRVLIVDDVAATRENIGKLMEFQPEIEAVGQAQSGEEALIQAKALHPDIVLMDINMPGMDGIAATERLSVEVPDASIIIMSVQGEQEYLRRAMMAGAKNYLTKPFTGDELINAVKDAYARDRKVRDAQRANSGARVPGKVISVFSGKGGVGKTTIAVNLAVSLALRPKTKVAIVDADIQFGDVALVLNVLPRSTIADVVAEKGPLEEKILAAYMTSYSDQLHVLAAPLRPEQAERVTGPLVGSVLKQLRAIYDYIIVDTASSFSEVTIASLDVSDTVLVVAGLDLPTVKNTKLAIEIMQSLGYAEDKILLALNRATPEGGIDSREVESSLKKPFVAVIPTDWKTAVSSINKGLPFVASNPEALVAQKIQALASILAPQKSGPEELAGKSSLRFKFFGR
jgi:pilus assembly protein CpaE